MSELAPHLPNLLVAYAAYVIATVAPGPSNIAVMATAMSRGRKPAFTMAFGIVLGSFTWAVLAALGVSAALNSYTHALYALKVAGGLYLLYLSWKSARSALRSKSQKDILVAAAPVLDRPFIRGLILHLTNPKAILAWIAIIALGLPAGAPAWTAAAIVFGCAILGITIYCGYAVIFSTPPVVRVYQNASRAIEGAMAVFFGYAGLRLLLSRS